MKSLLKRASNALLVSSVIIALVGIALQITTTLSALQVIALMGFLLSLVIGSILVWLLEELDRKFKSSREDSQPPY